MKSLFDIKITWISLFFVVFFFAEIAISFSGRKPEPMLVPLTTDLPLNHRLSNELSDISHLKRNEYRFEQFLAYWHIKGASMAIVKDGKLVYAKGFGYADKEKEVKVTPTHLFRIASVSKLITATTIMKMIDDGLLHLDSKVFGQNGILNDSIYLNYVDKRVENITIEQLLRHSAGWYIRYGDHMFIPHTIQKELHCEFPVSIKSSIKFALSKKLHFKPGSRSSYSNLGYVILGEVIEKVTGSTYEDYVKSTILNPLGIYDMHLGKNLYEKRLANEVTYYEQHDAELTRSIYGDTVMVHKSYGGNNIEALAAAGGWIASPVEIMKLVIAIDGMDNKPDFISDSLIQIMTNPSEQGRSPIGWKGAYQNGLWYRTGTLAGSSAMLKRQADGYSWIVLVNTSAWNGSKFPQDISRAMYHFLRGVQEWPEHDLFTFYPTTTNFKQENI